MRIVNEKCSPPRFKNEDINTVLSIIKPKDFMVTADIKNGFHHIPVCVDHQQYLGFQFEQTYYKWKVLPFGHTCSSYFFYKVLREAVKHFRTCGLRIVVYVDDIIICAQSDIIEHNCKYVLTTLEKLGFSINYDKSSLVPELCKPYIGYIIDNCGKQTVIKINKDRIRSVRKEISRALRKGQATARSLARIAGQCISMAKCVLPAKLLLRNLYRLLSTRISWQQWLDIDESTQADLQWWFDCLINQKIDIQLVTDA